MRFLGCVIPQQWRVMQPRKNLFAQLCPYMFPFSTLRHHWLVIDHQPELRWIVETGLQNARLIFLSPVDYLQSIEQKTPLASMPVAKICRPLWTNNPPSPVFGRWGDREIVVHKHTFLNPVQKETRIHFHLIYQYERFIFWFSHNLPPIIGKKGRRGKLLRRLIVVPETEIEGGGNSAAAS